MQKIVFILMLTALACTSEQEQVKNIPIPTVSKAEKSEFLGIANAGLQEATLLENQYKVVLSQYLAQGNPEPKIIEKLSLGHKELVRLQEDLRGYVESGQRGEGVNQSKLQELKEIQTKRCQEYKVTLEKIEGFIKNKS